jgi:hypothetical protein
VENITVDSSNAAQDRLIRTSKTLRKKMPTVTVTDSLPYVSIMINTETQRGKVEENLGQDFHATSHCANTHFTT